MKDKILIIDGHNAMWRASVRYGKPVKHNKCTVDTHKDNHPDSIHCACSSPWNEDENRCYGDMYHLVYSFFRNLKPIVEQFEPDKCFFVLEGHPKFRYNLLPSYKGNRIHKTAKSKCNKKLEKLEKFKQQKDIVLDLIKLLPITSCRAADFEADDVIGELCSNLSSESVTVLSNDSDFIQILQRDYDDVNIYNPIKKEFMSAPKYPYVAWKSLNGDKSDNIPKLLTPKKALKTINDPNLLRKFLESQENNFQFQRNRELIMLHPVPLDNIEIVDGNAKFNELKSRFHDMKFKSMVTDPYWSKFVSAFNCLKF